MERPAADSADQLLRVALDLFGRNGFDGTSTRDIASAAGKPMSAITYHFGGKDELYLAVARYLAARIGANLAPALAAAPAAMEDYGPAEARLQIHRIVEAFIAMMVTPESASWAPYILREQMEPTPAFEELFRTLMGPTIERLTGMIRRVSLKRLSIAEARLRVIALFGQVLVFRSCRAAVLRSNAWDEIGTKEAELIRTVIRGHLDAILDSLEAKDPS
jgi:TetR/AcrR family transcriptional regulator, regulator of cefoperazone and chloramphenicol sensitivity